MWAQILGTFVGATIGWVLAAFVIFHFLDYPPVHEVVEAILRALFLVAAVLA